MEGEGTPFRRVSLLPPSLPHPPRTSPISPPFWKRKFVSLFGNGGGMGGGFFVWGRDRGFTECGFALFLWAGRTERLRGAPFGLRPCRVRNLLEWKIVGNDPCVVPVRGKDTFPWVQIYPPHQSLTRQLPPKGKPFCKSLFVLQDKAISESFYTRPHPSPAATDEGGINLRLP